MPTRGNDNFLSFGPRALHSHNETGVLDLNNHVAII